MSLGSVPQLLEVTGTTLSRDGGSGSGASGGDSDGGSGDSGEHFRIILADEQDGWISFGVQRP